MASNWWAGSSMNYIMTIGEGMRCAGMDSTLNSVSYEKDVVEKVFRHHTMVGAPSCRYRGAPLMQTWQTVRGRAAVTTVEPVRLLPTRGI